VAREAICVVRGDIVRERFVWIVTRHAGDASVAFGPAAAVFETIGSEAHVEGAGADHLAGDDVLPSAVACAAKINGIDASELGGIERQSGAALFGFGAGGCDVLGAGTVAGFAGDAEKRGAGFELISRGGGGGVAAEAEASFARRDGAAGGVFESCRDGMGLAGSDVKRLR